MSLETATFVNALVETWPDGASDTVSQGDDHIRLLKASIKRTFPNIAGEISASTAELNYLNGVTSAIQTQLDAKANSADVPTLAGSNTFTAAQVISGSSAIFRLYESDAALNAKYWSWEANGGALGLYTRDDTPSGGSVPLYIIRSGTGVTSVALSASVTDQLKLTTGGSVTFTNGTVVGALSYSVTPTFQLGTSSNHNVDLVANAATRMTIRGDGPFKTQVFTVATLPAAGTVGTGARSFVTDANATTFASVVAGGGSNQLPVYSDGNNWRIG